MSNHARYTGDRHRIPSKIIRCPSPNLPQHERIWSKLHAMVWRRLIALFLLLILPAGGIWVAVARDIDVDESNDGSSAGDYCTIICHVEGHYCPEHDGGQQHSTCNISGGANTLVVGNALAPCISQEPIRLHTTIESEPATFVTHQTTASAVLEFPTPPPRASA